MAGPILGKQSGRESGGIGLPGSASGGTIMTTGNEGSARLYDEISSIVGPEHVSAEEFVRRSYTRGPFQALGGGKRGKTFPA